MPLQRPKHSTSLHETLGGSGNEQPAGIKQYAHPISPPNLRSSNGGLVKTQDVRSERDPSAATSKLCKRRFKTGPNLSVRAPAKPRHKHSMLELRATEHMKKPFRDGRA